MAKSMGKYEIKKVLNLMLPFNALLCETQYFSKVLKLISWKSCGEHICYIIFDLAIFESNLPFSCHQVLLH